MLEDDVQAATQQILVAGQVSKSGAERSAKLPDQPRSSDRRQEGPSRPEMPPLTPLSISYEKLLHMIQDMSDFRWSGSLKTDPSKRDHSKKCVYHKEHGHTTEVCRCLHYLVERLIRAGHLKQYLCSDAKGRDTSRNHNSETLRAPTAPKAIINHIDGGPFDEEYDSKRKRQRLLRAASPHRDTLILSLEIGDFDVRRILVDPGSSGNLVQASVISHMGHSLTGLENPRRILSGFNGASTTSLGDIVLPVQAGPVTLNTIQISEEETHLTYISSLLTPEEPRNIQDALRQSHDVFAWAHSDMKGIHPSIVSHKLNILPTARPVRQRVRRFHPDKQKIIQDEIDKLLEAGFIREVEYPDWLANVVVVPKKEGKWRVCVDYTNLNNVCPKNSFPLPRIDQIVDSIAGQGMLSFLDAFSGYHQILMSPADEEKIAFITPHGLYCYKVMSFRLKNAGVIYQTDNEDLQTFGRPDSREVFHLLRKYDMKSNPSKCAFGVSVGKFLRFMVSQRGIEVSLDQVKEVMETPPPRSKKELQRFTSKLLALGRFIAHFTDELRPFFLAIRKAGASGWTDSCQSAFEKIKHCLMQLPILSSPLPEEKLYMYLAVSE
ncbi:Transposon Ty3-I Gag-Pol polyprotein [Vitis vinifera]|uniref:Transposon Ty3-I Gag-Pol polyprotein n=1 Tax=Vitis vinifera TaxID=29760 RepID=A0A438IP53_VITVI|nr:Transposon Ty3-I Gag-Pol polyprotein [Vitis vinifera]